MNEKLHAFTRLNMFVARQAHYRGHAENHCIYLNNVLLIIVAVPCKVYCMVAFSVDHHFCQACVNEVANASIMLFKVL